ncbi:hypothetical protein D3C74_394590 [compost metagenome]
MNVLQVGLGQRSCCAIGRDEFTKLCSHKCRLLSSSVGIVLISASACINLYYQLLPLGIRLIPELQCVEAGPVNIKRLGHAGISARAQCIGILHAVAAAMFVRIQRRFRCIASRMDKFRVQRLVTAQIALEIVDHSRVRASFYVSTV